MNSKLKFKETEIGLIPEDWEETTIGIKCKIKNGKTNTQDAVDDGKYPLYDRSTQVKKSNKFIFDAEAVIIPGEGKEFNPKYYFGKFDLHQRAYAIWSENKEMNIKFIYYWIEKNKTYLSNIAVGSTVKSLRLNHLENFPLYLPRTIKEQSVIAKILSDLDSKIELLQKQNETLEKIGQAIFKHWFVDFEFPNEEGKPYKSSGGDIVESELGEIPKGWSVGKLGDLIYVQNGYAFKSSDFLSEGKHGIIKIKNISGNIIDIKNTQYTSDKVISKVDKKFKIESGDLLIAMTGAEVAKVGIVEKNNQSLWLNQRVGLFKETTLGGKMYSYVFLLDESKQSILKSNAHGAAQPNISASQIESLPIITPTKKIILNFFEIFNPAFNKIIGNLNEIKSLQKTRDLLLPKLMTGKIRVPLEVEE